MIPGGSRGHQKPMSGAPRAASWATKALLGTHCDARKGHLGVLGLQFGGLGGHFVAPMDRFGADQASML